jgi:3D-(3,5/4)-trihydroxycyclohexane-1,2-dione acylhydrolase (decyclizing)
VAPVLQQLESEFTQDISVNDAFKAVSRYWDRVGRPGQLSFTLMEAMRVLTSPANTGAVTLALPQDVQTEAWDYPGTLFEKRVWHIARPMADRHLLNQAVESIRKAKRPFLVAGGGIIYSDASRALASFVEGTGIPVGETMAGKGSLPYEHPQNLEALGVTGTSAANVIARDADLVIAVGTRLTDFTTASKTAFQNQDVQFININIAEFDAFKHAALPLVGDARVTLEEMTSALEGYRVGSEYANAIAAAKNNWIAETERLFSLRHGPPISQLEVIGIVHAHARAEDVVVCAAGSLPGDLHKLWRTRQPGAYHLEYGYSCMGYEIAGGLGVKMAAPEREVYVMVGDGSYLMMSSEIVTAIQEGYKLTIILLDNHGFSSIGGLSQAVGSGGFGTDYRYRNPETRQLDGDPLPIDFTANAASLGAHSIRATTRQDLQQALESARAEKRTTVIVVEVDKELRVPGYESWWNVAIAEVSESEAVRQARANYEKALKNERIFL